MLISYDQMTGVSYVQSWTEHFSLSQDELYDKVSADNETHIFPTEYGKSFADKYYYLFHMAHRIIDYKGLDKKNAIVIFSIDEKLLRDVCLSTSENNNSKDSFNFIVDESGRIVSYIDQENLTYQLTNTEATFDQRKEAYLDFVTNDLDFKEGCGTLGIVLVNDTVKGN